MQPTIGIFDLLSLLIGRGIVRSTTYNRTYCGWCRHHHDRQWYELMRTGDAFYVCIPTGRAMVCHPNGAGWQPLSLIDLVNRLLP
jgi:hypothetical protein